MIPIIVSLFKGGRPRTPERLLQVFQSVSAENCDLKRGLLTPIKGLEPQSPNPIAKAGAMRSIYKLRSGTWLYWANDVDVVEAAVTDSDSRIHYTGDGYPKQTDQTRATTGADASTYPNQTRRLGLPKPSAPLNIQLAPASVAADAEIERSTSYVYTYVTDWGEESEPSDPTAVIEVRTGQECVLSNFQAPTLAGATITHYRVYRLNSGDSSAEYQLVPWPGGSGDDMPASETTFTDNVADSNLSSEVLPTENWNRLPDDASGLMTAGNGLFFAFQGKDIYPSEVFISYAYPWTYRLSVPSDIVALANYEQTVVVLTKGHAHLINGLAPESLSMAEVSYPQSCVSKRSVASSPVGVIWASPDGLMMLGGEGMTNLTRQVYTRDQWRDLGPGNLMGWYQDGRYLGFFEGSPRGFLLDFEDGHVVDIVLTGKTVHGGHVDTEDDALYLLTHDGTNYRIEQWEGAATNMTYRWRAKDFFSSTAVNLGAARIMGQQSAGNPVTFKTYRDGVLLDTKTITHTRPFRLRAGMTGHAWSFELSGAARVSEVRMAPSITELQQEVVSSE